MRALLAVAVLCLTLTGCPQAGLEKPQSFDDQLAYAYSTHTGLAQTLHDLDFTGAINKTDYANAYSALNLTATMLSEAKFSSVTGDTTTATAKLAAVNSILNGLLSVVEQRRAGK